MPTQRTLTLTPEQEAALVRLRDHAPKPYLRERAAALLKVAGGACLSQVARSGLLQPRARQTVAAWLDRYQVEGLAGLTIRPGRGRKPALPATPSASDDPLRHLLGRSPHTLGYDQSRWTLALLRDAEPRLAELSHSGIWRLLVRHGISYRRARAAVHSPDPDDAAKQAAIAQAQALADASGGRIVLLYLDEVTVERQPSLAPAYAPIGEDAPRAQRSHRANTLTRVVATLDRADARVVATRASHIRVTTLVAFYHQVVAAYPAAERIYLVMDNWPVHFHPDVLVALEPQATPFPLRCPPSWPTQPTAGAVARWGAGALPIQVLPLPTYASWCNPIEKLWRWLKQTLIHLHPFADDLPDLRAAIDDFLARFDDGSEDLLRYVGLMAA